jgi:hypothetical protein
MIYVDADGCPNVIKEILFRAGERAKTNTLFVANQFVKVPNSNYLSTYQVESGFDVADNYIAQQVVRDDLVITSDIPLADEVITKGATAISFRGELYTTSNIKAKLTMRNFMSTLRDSGVETGGKAPFSQADRQQFANQLGQWLLTQKRKRQ